LAFLPSLAAGSGRQGLLKAVRSLSGRPPRSALYRYFWLHRARGHIRRPRPNHWIPSAQWQPRDSSWHGSLFLFCLPFLRRPPCRWDTRST